MKVGDKVKYVQCQQSSPVKKLLNCTGTIVQIDELALVDNQLAYSVRMDKSAGIHANQSFWFRKTELEVVNEQSCNSN